MTETNTQHKLSLAEFSAMMAYMISIVALSIDAMLPVLGTIGTELGVSDPNKPQWIIGAFFLGLAIGQIIYGPVSDTIGRQRSILIGIGIFVIGCIISTIATDFNTHIFGRALQGLGAAGPRIVSMAIIRDNYSGREMAKVASVIMGFFIVVPAIAPALGQWIAYIGNWQAIYIALLAMAVINFIWYAVRLGETLPPERRRPFDAKSIISAIIEICTTRISIGYTLAAGIAYAGFYIYLSTAPQLFESEFGITDKFPYYFGALSLAVGGAALVNSRLVMRLGARRLAKLALAAQVIISLSFFSLVILKGGTFGVNIFLLWAALVFFSLGVMFGNINAIALEPLGHIAGISSAFIGSVTNLLSLVLGAGIVFIFDVGISTLIGAFMGFGILALAILRWADP